MDFVKWNKHICVKFRKSSCETTAIIVYNSQANVIAESEVMSLSEASVISSTRCPLQTMGSPHQGTGMQVPKGGVSVSNIVSLFMGIGHDCL